MKIYSSKQKESLRHLISAAVFLLFLVAILGVNNYVYLSNGKDLFAGDQISHLINSIDCFRNDVDVFSSNRSPGVFLLTKYLYRLFSVNEYVAISTNLIFAFFLFGATYFITYKIAKDKLASAYSAVLLFLYPITYGLSRFYLMELSLMAAVTVSIAFLIYSDGFRDLKFSFLAGIAMGLGTLSKGSFFIFVFAPLVFQVYLLLKHRLFIKRIKNIIIFFTTAFILTNLWFLTHPGAIIKDGLTRIINNGNNAQLNSFSLKNILFYLYPIIDFNISPVLFLVFLIALIPFLRGKFKERGMLFCWILFPYFLFSFFPAKLARYLSPIAPAFAIITSVGFSKLRIQYRRFIYAITIIFGIVQFVGLSYDTPFLKEEYFIKTKIMSRLFSLKPLNYHEDFWICWPQESNSGSLKALEIIKEYERGYNIENLSICRILNRKSPACPSGWIEHHLSSSLEFYNLSKGYNYSIRECALNNKQELMGWPEGSITEGANGYDVVLSYGVELPEYIDRCYILIDRIKIDRATHLYIYLNKSILKTDKGNGRLSREHKYITYQE